MSKFHSRALHSMVLLWAVFLFPATVFGKEPAAIHYVKIADTGFSKSHKAYVSALLEAVMDVTEEDFGPYEILVRDHLSSAQRLEVELKSGEWINVIWAPEVESSNVELITIPFPTLKGMLGYRALIITKDKQALFDKVESVEDLRELRPGQADIWRDTDIYRHNEFDVVTAPALPNLFYMLQRERFDFLPLGINEVKDELALYQKELPELTIEKNLLIHYPFNVHFSVSPKTPEIARRIETGLARLESTGEFEKLFNEFFKNDFVLFQEGQRKIIQLENPFPLTTDDDSHSS